MTVLGFKKGLMNNNRVFNSTDFVPGTMLNALQMLTLITNLYPLSYTLCWFPFLWDKERLNDLSVFTKLVGSGDMQGWIDWWMDWMEERMEGSWMDGGREDRKCGWVHGWKEGRNEDWMKERMMEGCVTEANFSPLSYSQQSQSSDTGLCWRKVQHPLWAPDKGSRAANAQKTQTPLVDFRKEF